MAKDTIIIPDGTREIRDFEFAGLRELRHVVIPDSVERIGTGAFNESGVGELVFPASATSKERICRVAFISVRY